MALSVIGAGFGRTGTMSLKSALEILGFGPCHHMLEVVSNPQQLALWREAAQGRLPDWDEALAGYRSSVDWPTAHYWRHLSAHYPKAKIILTVRSPEKWYASFTETILKAIGPDSDPLSFGVAAIRRQIFNDRPEDRDHAIAVYKAHIAEVQSAFGPERLLTYETGEGWPALCKFLGVDIPAEPYPQSNSTTEFQARIAKK